MSIETFSHLKEIQSLDNLIKKLLDQMQAEEKRLEDITKLRVRRTNEREELIEENASLQKKISTKEKDLFEFENRVEKAKQNQSMASNEKEVESLEKELSLALPKVEELQNQILELMEEGEQLEEKMKEIDSFLLGSQETLDEIKAEIAESNQPLKKQILDYEIRIDALKDQVPPALWEVFTKAREKHRFNQSLVRILNKACEKCRFEVDALTAARVEAATGFEVCSQCGRLLIPLEA